MRSISSGICVLVVFLTACGGGISTDAGQGNSGGSGGSGEVSSSTGSPGTEAGSSGTETAQNFSIGGSIAGLNFKGLSLSNNGADSIVVERDATTFTFPTRLSSGASFNVAVQSYPYGQFCALDGAAGTAKENVNSVAVNCENWSSTNSLVSTFAGSGSHGSTNGIGTAASFALPSGIAATNDGTLYIVDKVNHSIRQVTAEGVVTTLAGGSGNGDSDGIGENASFYNPTALALDSNGNIFVSDTSNNQIRKVTPAGVVTTFAGNADGSAGNADGIGLSASFNAPFGIAIDADDNIYVADSGNNQIRKLTPDGVVTIFAGSPIGSAGYADDTGVAALFNNPVGMAVDTNGNVFVSDNRNQRIRKITSDGVVTTFAGSGNIGTADGAGVGATFSFPRGIAIDPGENIYIVDGKGIRKITVSGDVTTLAGNGVNGKLDGAGNIAQFLAATFLTSGKDGTIFVADSGNALIRKITRNSL